MQLAPKQDPAQPSKDSNPRKSRRRPGLLFRVLAPVLAPLIFFGALEGLLRLGGYGYPTSFFLHRTLDGKEVLTENPKFTWRFFGPALARVPYPLMLSAAKQPGTVRIFVFGESAAYGDPQPDFGLPRMLSVLLRERYPGTKFEVVNAAMVAINSNVILPLARECAREDGDIWVIYMGNNEVVGPYGSGTVFSPQVASLPVIRGTLALKATRTGELLSDLLQHLGGGQAGLTEWRGMTMFVRNQVRHDDPRMKFVYSHFGDNLSDMLQTAADHRVRTVVSTVASNLRDCAPFASLHREGLTDAQLTEWEKQYQAGIEAEHSGRMPEAVAHYQQAALIDDQFADLQFRWARGCLTAGNDEEARKHYTLARDYDALRFRADTRINEIIRQRGNGREAAGIYFADSEAALAQGSPHGLPGSEMLYEHVHLTFEGNYLLARTIADQVARALPEEVKRRAAGDRAWLSATECARALGWSDWNLRRAFESLRLDSPPFTYQLDHVEQSRRRQQEVEKLSSAQNPEFLRRQIEEYRQLAVATPGDWVFPHNLAFMQKESGDLAGAAESWRQVSRLLPFNGESHLQLGLILSQQGRLDDAFKQFEIAFELSPAYARSVFVDILNDTATSLAQRGNYAAAVQLLRQALEFQPDFAAAGVNLAVTLSAMGKTTEAQEQLRAVLRRPPATSDGLLNLGKACLGFGWTNEAVACFNKALKLDPVDAAVHCGLGDALAATGSLTDAGKEYAEAVRLEPDFAEAHLNWGIALLKQQSNAAARAHFQEARRLNPMDEVAANYIRSLESQTNR